MSCSSVSLSSNLTQSVSHSADTGTVSDQFVSNIMRDMNLKSIRTTSKKEHLRDRRRQSILKQKFDVNDPNKVWASDVTYFRYNDRFYYICAVIVALWLTVI